MGTESGIKLKERARHDMGRARVLRPFGTTTLRHRSGISQKAFALRGKSPPVRRFLG